MSLPFYIYWEEIIDTFLNNLKNSSSSCFIGSDDYNILLSPVPSADDPRILLAGIILRKATELLTRNV